MRGTRQRVSIGRDFQAAVRRAVTRRTVWCSPQEMPITKDDALRALLAAIAADVDQHASAVASSIRSEFSIKIQDACQRAPKHELAAILRALQDARATALVVASQKATMDIHGRQKAAIAARPAYQQQPIICFCHTQRVPR